MNTRLLNFMNIDDIFKQDFINTDNTVAISSEGIVFKIGDIIEHNNKELGKDVIEKFSIADLTKEIIAHTKLKLSKLTSIHHPLDRELMYSIDYILPGALSREKLIKYCDVNNIIVEKKLNKLRQFTFYSKDTTAFQIMQFKLLLKDV